MCSPFSTAFWRNSLSGYQNLDRPKRESRLGSIHEETDERVLFDKDSESFRNFTSPKQILSHTWRERIIEKLPLWQKRQTSVSIGIWPNCKFNFLSRGQLEIRDEMRKEPDTFFLPLSKILKCFEVVLVTLFCHYCWNALRKSSKLVSRGSFF